MFEKFDWNTQIKFLQRDTRTIIVNFNNGFYIKLKKQAFDYINKARTEGVNKTLSLLDPKEKEKFLRLLQLLKDNLYIVEGNEKKSQPLDYMQIPKLVYYEASERCNLKCKFCYANPKVHYQPYMGDSKLTKKIFDRLAELNVAYLIFSGGEPLLRTDLVELIHYARERFQFISMTTNGTLLGKDEAKKLKETGINYIQISIESGDEQFHDSLRGKGNFKKSINAVNYLKDAGFKEEEIYITATLSKPSIRMLKRFSDFAKSLGVRSSFSYYQPVGRGAEGKDKFFLFSQELLKFYFEMMKEKGEILANAADCSDLSGFETSERIIPNIRSFCGIGAKTLAVKEFGDIVPCHLFLSSPSCKIGNIFEDDIADKLYKNFKLLPSIDEIEGCKDCDIRYFCGNGCSAHVYWNYKTFNKRNPYCDFFYNYLSAIIWNLGEENETRRIYESLLEKISPGLAA